MSATQAELAFAPRALTDDGVRRVELDGQWLDPIAEARRYAELRAEGMTQREIAQRCHVSQPQVSKRLQLLELPLPEQQAIAAGAPVEAASRRRAVAPASPRKGD